MICRINRMPLLVVALFAVILTPLHSNDWGNLRLIQESRKDPYTPVQGGKSRFDLRDSSNELEMAGLALLRLYQVILSSQDGPRCMFHPSCSEYAKQALVKRGAVVGSLLAIDRYLRCNGLDRDLYPYDPSLKKLLDPVPERKSKPPQK